VSARLTLFLLLLAAGPVRADTWWGTDKALHLSVSIGLAAGATAVTAAWIEGPLERAAIGIVSSLTLGVAKELADGLGLGEASFRDLTWDLIGSVIGASLAWIVERWIVSPLLDSVAPRFAG
jgi:putative lipoprotein